jgi:hypothetical protein
VIGLPVVLSSGYTFPSTTINSIATPSDPAALRSPKNNLLIDSIQLWIGGLEEQGRDPGQPTAGDWHEWDIKLGRAQLTAGYVPPAICCRNEESYPNPTSAYATPFLWTFPRPLFVPMGSVLQVKVKSGVKVQCYANVAFHGRVLPEGNPIPGSIPVPYACMFRPPIVTLANAETDPRTYIYKSGKSDLDNPFPVPLQVVRFTIGTSPIEYAGYWGAKSAIEYFPKIRIADSRGRPVIREALRVGQMLSLIRGDLPVDFMLQPSEALYATIDQTHIANQTGMAADAVTQMALGMVGWRNVPISEVR